MDFGCSTTLAIEAVRVSEASSCIASVCLRCCCASSRKLHVMKAHVEVLACLHKKTTCSEHVNSQAFARSYRNMVWMDTSRCGWTLNARPPLPSKLLAWVKPTGSVLPSADGAAQPQEKICIGVQVFLLKGHM